MFISGLTAIILVRVDIQGDLEYVQSQLYADSFLLENLCIASISLGAARDFILTHKKPPDKDDNGRYRKRFSLANGSLVIMQGETQKYWKHEIVSPSQSFRHPVLISGLVSCSRNN